MQLSVCDDSDVKLGLRQIYHSRGGVRSPCTLPQDPPPGDRVNYKTLLKTKTGSWPPVTDVPLGLEFERMNLNFTSLHSTSV